MPHFRLAWFLAVPMLSLLAACSDLSDTVSDTLGGGQTATPATGLAVADEPLAAKTGAAVLADGGSAADAVTAMFFTLTATYPAAAGLGGGGICLLRTADGTYREFDFLARKAENNGPFAVPGAPRGFYDLQKMYGTLPWQRDVAPGEGYAASGFPISYALAQRIVAAAPALKQDPSLAAEFLDAAGKPKPGGTVVGNEALSETLAQLRLSGPDAFYGGSIGAELVASGGFAPGELSAMRTGVFASRPLTLGAYTVAMPGGQTGAGSFAGTLMGNISRAAQGRALPAAVALAVRQTLARFGIATLPPDFGATGFAAVDTSGQAAACAVTLNGPFGAGRTAGKTGVGLAASPATPFGYSTAFLTPVLAADSGGQIAFAGTGSGGPNGTGAVQYALFRLAGGQSVGRPGDLLSTGAAPFATVNAISCQSGSCVALSDPGGHGLAAAADLPDAAQP